MNKLSLVVLSLLFCSLLGANTLVLKETATVSDHIVRIKDIALMDAPTRNRIGNLVISVSPELGKSDSIPRNEIYQKLLGNGVQSPRIEGASSVRVTRKGISVSPSYFKDKILNYITTHSRWKNGVQVKIVTSKPFMIPEKGVRWQLNPANGQDFFGDILFKLKAFSRTSSELLYSGWIVAQLKIQKSVAVSNRTIQKGETIGVGDLRWETREISVFTKNAVLDRRGVVGQKSGRIIRPNTVITTNLLAKKYMVQRGGSALLIAKLGSVKATSTVRVLSNGGMGDTVRVMNLGSRKILSAVVTGQNKLEVLVQ